MSKIIEPSATATYLFATMRAAIDQAIAERDPGVATMAGERFMTPATPLNAPYHRHFAYSYQDGANSVSFTYTMRNRSTPMREEEDRHDFLLLLKVDGIEHDKHHKLLCGDA